MQEVTSLPVPTASCLLLSTPVHTDVPEDCPAEDSHDKTNTRIAHATMRTNRRIPRTCCRHFLTTPSGERRTRPTFRQHKPAAELEEN